MERAVIVAVLAGAALGAGAAPCPAPLPSAFPALLTERFLSAACASCWSSAAPATGAVLDWVAPAGDEAALADRAIAEAPGRAAGLAVDRPLLRQWALSSAARLRVVDGFALNGYIGLQLEVSRTGAPPRGLAGYMALVERIPAGRDGTPVERQLVRAVVGPLSLAELDTRRSIRHLAAVRVPAMAQPERLGSVAWLEDTEGTVVQFTRSRPLDCR